MTTFSELSIEIAPAYLAVFLMNVESITTLLDPYILIAPPLPIRLVLLVNVELIKTLLAMIWIAEPLLLLNVVFKI